MSFRQRLRSVLCSRWLVLVNVLLAALAVVSNHFFQFFCRPVPWASFVLVISFAPVLFFNILGTQVMRRAGLVSFLLGTAACVCMYCILFIGRWHLIALFIVPLGWLAYLPHFLLVQIIAHVFSRTSPLPRRPFFGAIGTACAFVIGMSIWFNANIAPVANALRSDPAASSITPSYMTERMLGMHWKYHMSFCAYDGWRPPLHDPALVAAASVNSMIGQFPWYFPTDAARDTPWSRVDLPDTRRRPQGMLRSIHLYARLFPDRPIKETCSCAVEGSGDYRYDPLWRAQGSTAR